MRLADVVQFTAGILSLYSLKLHGDMTLKGPAVGVVAQLVWIAVMIITPAWGMFPAVLGFLFVNIRNFVRWHRAGVRWRSTQSIHVER